MSGENLVGLLLQRGQSPGAVAASWRTGGRWEDVTWGQLVKEVQVLSAGLVAQGVKPGDRVAIFADTSLQWVVCDLAISAARAITVPIYASNTPEEARYILNHSEASLVLVDHDQKAAKQPGRATRVREKLAECPSVRQVVLFEGPAAEGELTLEQLREQGRRAQTDHPEAFDQRAQAVKAEDVCCIIYTSGTTGDPKGVLLSHGNWAYEACSVRDLGLMAPDDSVMMFLPMAHSFGQVVKAAWLSMGYRLVFAESTDKLMENIQETRPTLLPAVPRVFEKVYNKVVGDGTSAPGLQGRLVRWAFALFDEYVEARTQGREFPSWGFALARKLVFSKLRQRRAPVPEDRPVLRSARLQGDRGLRPHRDLGRQLRQPAGEDQDRLRGGAPARYRGEDRLRWGDPPAGPRRDEGLLQERGGHGGGA
jgi:long-chain acyl-CoA synthetase